MIRLRDAVIPEDFAYLASKSVHVLAYALFAILTSRLPARRWLLLLVILHGPLTEFLQQFTDRTPQLTDVGLDWLGVGLGVLVTWRNWRSSPTP
jgi:hypothetical protein